METTVVPCNSLADLGSELLTSFNSPLFSNDTSVTRSLRRSKASISDFQIIQECMSPERKKTLICAEQSNFSILHKFKIPASPIKKFKARAPSEYEKYIMKIEKINDKKTESVRYEYPEDVLSCKEIREIKNLQPEEFSNMKNASFRGKGHRRNKTSACAIF